MGVSKRKLLSSGKRSHTPFIPLDTFVTQARTHDKTRNRRWRRDLDKKFRNRLEHYLLANETVEFCLLGLIGPDQLLAALNDRILILRTDLVSFLQNKQAESLPYKDIHDIGLRRNPDYYAGKAYPIEIFRSDSPLEPAALINVDKGRLDEYRPYINRINAKIHEAKSTTGTELVAELERLAALRNSGALTEAEFRQAKSQLLG